MQTVTLARNAMATRFEIVLHGEDAVRLRAAGEEAFNEIERLEGQLSLYRPSSEIARVNAWAAARPVKLSLPVFQLLRQAQQLSRETQGAFDITIAPLVRCWGFMGEGGRKPSAAEVEEARAKVGMEKLLLDDEDCAARFAVEGAMLDLGGIGKGYAIDCAAETLREAGVTSALLHGGTSTVYGLGSPPGTESWKVAIDGPAGRAPVAVIELYDSALSVSAAWGKSFAADGQTFGHVLDPRTGWPAAAPGAAALAAVGLPSATETDAFSTALLVRGAEGHDSLAGLRAAMATLTLTPRNGDYAIQSRNIALCRA